MNQQTESNAPIEMERKFLVDVVGEIPESQATEIVQTYLNPGAETDECRVRKRCVDGRWLYFLTSKKKVATGRREEVEREISEPEYRDFLRFALPDRITIHKYRSTFLFDNRCFELDKFVSPKLSHFLLEIEGVTMDDEIKFPPFIKVIREVTEDESYYNSNLSKQK